MKIISTLATATAGLALLAGAAAAQTTTLRIQTQQSPESPAGQLAAEWVQNVEAMSGGDIDIEMFYSSAVVKSAETFDAAANGILDCRDYLKYIHLSESDRGTPGEGCCDWDEVFATLKAIDFKGGLAMESFINMPPEIGFGLAVWRPVAKDHEEVMSKGLPFLRNKAAQYRLI